MTARELLLRAADHIERYGWMQGELGPPGSRCCALGAIAAVQTTYWARSEAATTLEAWLLRQRGSNSFDGGFSITFWNDTLGRTAAEVVAALRAAAGGAA